MLVRHKLGPFKSGKKGKGGKKVRRAGRPPSVSLLIGAAPSPGKEEEVIQDWVLLGVIVHMTPVALGDWLQIFRIHSGAGTD